MLRFLNSLIFLPCLACLAADEENHLPIPAEIDEALRAEPMPELGDTRVERILMRYYAEGIGGTENWGGVERVNVIGQLRTEETELRVNAFHKKPNFTRISLSPQSRLNELILAYDGKLAWMQQGRDGVPEPMGEAEARRFIHNSEFGNYLLHPFATGKRIRLVDTVPVEGTICHQIRVELDSGFQVDYFIDIRSYLEIKIVNTDLRDGSSSSDLYKDYDRVGGMPIAKRVESYVDGKWVSTLLLDEVRVNSGVMPWMFEMPD